MFAQRLLDLLFPPRCVGCGAVDVVLCPACLATIRPLVPPLCARCGAPLAATRGGGAAPTLCPVCAEGGFPPHLDGVRVAAHYEGATRKAILALKFRGQRRAAEPLGELLARTLLREALPADALVPVPLHAARERERGYNQAALLARGCARHVGLPVHSGLLRRTRATAPQTHLSAAERWANLTGAFALAATGARDHLAGKRIILVDDVTTTGSTLAAAAAALAPAHPAAVWGLAVARPDLHAPGDR